VLKQSLSADDKIILDRLLSKLAGYLNGGLDVWTLVCLGDFSPDRRAFIRDKCEVMRSLVVVTKAILAEAQQTGKEPMRILLDKLAVFCQKQEQAFLVLAECRTVPLHEVRAATEAVAEVYTGLREAIRQLGEALDVPISFWQTQTAESESYFQRILRGLFDQFAHTLAAEKAAAAAPS
jgi:hypothetical protein